MDIIQYAELIYYITAGPILTIIVGFGIRQIFVAEKAIKVNSRRDAYRLSGEQIKYYMEVIIPYINDYNRYIKDKGIEDPEKLSTVDLNSNGITVSCKIPKKSFDVMFSQGSPILKVLNSMEVFATPLCTGLASEEIIYNSLAKTYTNSVREMLPFIVVAGDGYFTNTMKLFTIWHKRREAERLSDERSKIEDQINTAGNSVVVRIIGEE
jgi:hypothetical protein